MKETLDWARTEILAGRFPKAVLAENKKTGVTILDNVPQLTCYGACPIRHKCYDVKILKLRPNVLKARALRHFMIEKEPMLYADQAWNEIYKSGATKVRVYGGGDYHPSHFSILAFLLRAMPDITFYMISKTIRNHPMDALLLLEYPNFFLNLSECKDYYFGEEWSEIAAHPRVNRVYTLLEEDKDYARAANSDIIFNVSKSAKNIAEYKLNRLPLCPCDAKDIPSKGACGDCGLCSTKGGVRLN